MDINDREYIVEKNRWYKILFDMTPDAVRGIRDDLHRLPSQDLRDISYSINLLVGEDDMPDKKRDACLSLDIAIIRELEVLSGD